MRPLQKQLMAQLSAAAVQLTRGRAPTDSAIHKARQHIKRARAILRLLHSMVNAEAYAHLNRHLRQVNRRLRTARDDAAAGEALVWIGESTLYMSPAVLTIQRSWRRSSSQPEGAATVRDSLAAQRHVARAIAALRDWEPVSEQRELVLRALQGSYRKARRAYRHAERTDSKVRWHDCRKATKSLYYQWQAVRPLVPGCAAAMPVARRLESALGRERDLCLLTSKIRRTAVAQSPTGVAMLEHIRQRRSQLRRKYKTLRSRAVW